MIDESVAELIELLDIAETNADRAEAVALLIAALTTEPAFRRFLAARAHVVVRGGVRTLVREMLSTITSPTMEISVLADIAEARGRALGIGFARVATTRGFVSIGRGPRRHLTLETHGHEIGGLHWSPDGTRLVAFVSSLDGWDPAVEGGLGGSCIAQWDPATGRFLGAARAGQFREGNGAMGINPSMTLAAVRSHREIAIHPLEGKKRGELRRIRLDEGPNDIVFLDDHTLLTNNAYELIVADAETGGVIRAASTVGRAFVHARGLDRVFVGGSSSSGVSIATHDFTSLELLSRVKREGVLGRGLIETIALSPSEDTIATGDWNNDVRVWSVRNVMSASPDEKRAKSIASVHVGKHDGWVSASAFIDGQRLLTAGWDGALIEWNLQRREATHRAHGHYGYVTALALDAERKRAATGASDGRIVVWDLEGELGESPPPFIVSYGGHRLPLAMSITAEEVRIVVGTREAFFERSTGKLLRSGECSVPTEMLSTKGFESDDIEDEVTTAADDECLLLVGAEVLHLDAPARGFMWLDVDTLIVLDSAGHVELWSRSR